MTPGNGYRISGYQVSGIRISGYQVSGYQVSGYQVSGIRIQMHRPGCNVRCGCRIFERGVQLRSTRKKGGLGGPALGDNVKKPPSWAIRGL